MVRTASAPLNLAFRLAHVANQGRAWVEAEYPQLTQAVGGSLDARSLCLAALALHATVVIMLRQAARISAPPAAAAASSTATTKNGKAPLQQPQHRDSPLLLLAQQHHFALAMLYVHVMHPGVLDGLFSNPVGLALLAVLLLSLYLAPSTLRARFGAVWARWVFLLPPTPSEVLWTLLGYGLTRYALPATSGSGLEGWSIDPFQLGPGGAGAGAAGAGEAAREAAREERAGSELCAYSWRGAVAAAGGTGGLVSTAALRTCVDVSLLVLIYAGLVYPLVEFGRALILRCAKLHSKDDVPSDEGQDAIDASASAATPSASSPALPASTATLSASQAKRAKKKQKLTQRSAAAPAAATPATTTTTAAPAPTVVRRDADDDDDEDDDDEDSAAAHGHAHGKKKHGGGGGEESSLPLFARLLACSHMAALCMVVTWVVSLVSLALGNEYGSVLPAEDSGCPSPLTLGGGLSGGGLGGFGGTFDRESSFLRDAPCALQWSLVQSGLMAWYGVGGLLAALFGLVLPNPLPPPFRIQVFTVAAIAVWKGNILPACTVIASKCMM